MQFEVTESEDRWRLDEVLAARLTSLSRMFLRGLITDGKVLIDGQAEPPGRRVRQGQAVQVVLPDDAFTAQTAMTPEQMPLHILFEDPHLVVVEKPSGMVVHPAGRHRSGTLVNGLVHHFNVAGAADPPIRPGVVHRLDRATSGLIVIAKTQKALSRLTVAFQERRVEKRYTALVHGLPPTESGEWHAPIGNSPDTRPCWGIREDGRPAHTRYQVVEVVSPCALLELEPVTGRTNQLRLHCAHFGHPIVGDDLFGLGATDGADRLLLHAHRLAFPHPVTAETMAFASPLPEEFRTYGPGEVSSAP